MIQDRAWLETDFMSTVQQRGAEIIKARGASSAASAANAALMSVKAIINDTAENDCFSICSCSNGQYDVDEGLIFSFPSKVQSGVFSTLEGFEQPTFGEEKIKVTLDELRQERDTVKELGLIP